MKSIHQRIWVAALPFQAKRDDEGHAEVTLAYAIRLLELEQGDADVVIPAIILHDTGWSSLSREERMSIFASTATAENKRAVRLRHEEAGAEIAATILSAQGYPARLTEEIVEIISGHDTRPGFLSQNDGLTRDADKLWRFSATGFEADVARYAIPPQTRITALADLICKPDFFYCESARHIAREELALRNQGLEPVPDDTTHAFGVVPPSVPAP
ncbi:HD domain-containing protein [Pseudodesulfovibrio cashew]|uniref:HD domain-containing protein n=1 Tax=Pseudodesulfovibrio cashew TaxID=2678688 RepID=A0A6I6JL94_9BACT|nr:HD domain-containing protein [Pseudodesulfovibrio cashew]QGY40907.1 HD domain-containing protein [Pseudodesulfovibrio cashew]